VVDWGQGGFSGGRGQCQGLVSMGSPAATLPMIGVGVDGDPAASLPMMEGMWEGGRDWGEMETAMINIGGERRQRLVRERRP